MKHKSMEKYLFSRLGVNDGQGRRRAISDSSNDRSSQGIFNIHGAIWYSVWILSVISINTVSGTSYCACRALSKQNATYVIILCNYEPWHKLRPVSFLWDFVWLCDRGVQLIYFWTSFKSEQEQSTKIWSESKRMIWSELKRMNFHLKHTAKMALMCRLPKQTSVHEKIPPLISEETAARTVRSTGHFARLEQIA